MDMEGLVIISQGKQDAFSISDRRKIKSAPEESVENTQTSDGNLLLAVNISTKYFIIKLL